MDLDQLWKNTQEELRVVLAPAVYQTFVVKTQLISLQGSEATIACSNAYLCDLNQKRYYQLFKSALDNQTKKNNNLKFIVQEIIKNDENNNLSSSPLFSYQPKSSVVHLNQAGLHPNYTLDNLVVGNSNNFAYAAAQGIIKNPGLSYNPFFIWGGVGVGKTHLMQAIGHQLLKNNPDLKIKYFPAETFGNELINALKTKAINPFKNKYRQLDCILVDDIQFLAGKEYIQEEFFHTFNALHLAGKQIILTSDRKPGDIKELEDRLVSRFMGGLTVDIQPPDLEMRSAIIQQKAQNKGIDLTFEAVQFLADNIQSNIRDIEGKIQEIAVVSLAQNHKLVDIDLVQNYFSSQNGSLTSSFSSSSPKLNARHLLSVCAKHFNIKTGDLCGSSRKKELVTARHITAYLLLTEIKLPLKEVGELLGGRDHTSIMHARDKVSTDLLTSPPLKEVINQIKNSL
ncbi:MAG: chromosomal replication initiator protein DnaA [Candidatus Shapirobacteria bacterium]|jgi:chromosomal replication initiator protein|nr:chromosomal replication initiator protein DnaA [Candidatus Shapirobacteria bacterium]